ncbi:aminotransferase class V-fold PLP-dependent enzyme [Telmatobacter sp. DSM 110680]|uniref:Aminotransferase class V-fold PLP-dependent enzyme n=1 Tax=Telmatobacter sp. DSM 110680 TaxID=3036704 RepID=A0AAU7DQ02_9BACT
MLDVQFRQADSAEDIEQVHRLNHRIFSEEVGQHPRTSDGRLIDKFHDRNRYFIAICGSELVGMVSAHDGPEFSITSRLENLRALKVLRAPLEIRLLAILPKFRNRSILAGLFWQVRSYARKHHYSDLLISGIVERLSMYEKMGFKAMGPAIPCGAAAFVPMRLSLDAALERFERREQMYGARWRRSHATSLLPGPVAMSESVIEAFHQVPISHRSQRFIELYEELRRRLGELMGGLQPVVLCGSGTLANDAIAANLRCAFGNAEGLVIANGEFGERLIRQAACAGLNYRALKFGWGDAWSFRAIERELERSPRWVWVVHLETSTGVLNDLRRLTDLASQHGSAVAADCVSSLGAVDTGEAGRRLFLASGVSGKALASYAGLAFVFLSQEAIVALEGKTICPTFDLIAAVQGAGPTSTLPSPLVMSALQALRENYNNETDRAARYKHYEELGRWARGMMREVGLELLAAEKDAAPTIATFPIPSKGFAQECLTAGFRIAHESDYLRARDWGQIATMGNLDKTCLESLFSALKTYELGHEA